MEQSTKKNKKLVVFDLDGTLNRTELYAVPAHHALLREMGLPDRSDKDIISCFGARAQDCIVRLTGRTDPEFLAEYARRAGKKEQEMIRERADCYKGVRELLFRLRQDGYETAVCSNSYERYIHMVLKALQLEEWIDHIQPLVPELTKNDTLGILLLKTAPAAAVMAGDRIFDFDAARANRVPFIGCLYGFNPQEVEEADEAVHSAAEIYGAVKRLIG